MVDGIKLLARILAWSIAGLFLIMTVGYSLN